MKIELAILENKRSLTLNGVILHVYKLECTSCSLSPSITWFVYKLQSIPSIYVRLPSMVLHVYKLQSISWSAWLHSVVLVFYIPRSTTAASWHRPSSSIISQMANLLQQIAGKSQPLHSQSVWFYDWLRNLFMHGPCRVQRCDVGSTPWAW